MDLTRRFRPLLGLWTGLERLGGDGPEATTARASLVLRLDLAGSLVVLDYRQVRADGTELTAHGVFRAGSDEEEVRWWLFDSGGGPPVVDTGRWEGDALVLDRPGRVHRLRGDGDALEQHVTDRTCDDAPWRRVLTGAYRRTSGH